MEKIINSLSEMGLSFYESKIYIDLIQSSKPKGATKIGVSTKLKRQYVYRGLEDLLTKGLVIKIPYGKRNKYKAENEKLLLKIKRKELEETELLVEEIKKISKSNVEQDFEVIIGEDNFKRFEINRYKNLKKDSLEYAILASSDHYLKIMGEEYYKIGLPMVLKSNTKYMMIGGSAPFNIGSIKEKLGSNFLFKRLVNFNSGFVSTLISDSSVYFYTYVNPPTIYAIHSNKIADSYKNFFLSLWEKL